jgi:hypothetical protein
MKGHKPMFALKQTPEKQTIRLLQSTTKSENSEELQKQELRRQMYERIAQGNTLSEVEDKASRHWGK